MSSSVGDKYFPLWRIIVLSPVEYDTSSSHWYALYIFTSSVPIYRMIGWLISDEMIPVIGSDEISSDIGCHSNCGSDSASYFKYLPGGVTGSASSEESQGWILVNVLLSSLYSIVMLTSYELLRASITEVYSNRILEIGELGYSTSVPPINLSSPRSLSSTSTGSSDSIEIIHFIFLLGMSVPIRVKVINRNSISSDLVYRKSYILFSTSITPSKCSE